MRLPVSPRSSHRSVARRYDVNPHAPYLLIPQMGTNQLPTALTQSPLAPNGITRGSNYPGPSWPGSTYPAGTYLGQAYPPSSAVPAYSTLTAMPFSTVGGYWFAPPWAAEKAMPFNNDTSPYGFEIQPIDINNPTPTLWICDDNGLSISARTFGFTAQNYESAAYGGLYRFKPDANGAWQQSASQRPRRARPPAPRARPCPLAPPPRPRPPSARPPARAPVHPPA